MKISRSLIAFVLATASFAVLAQEKMLNLYSARHYQTDEALYADFTRQTGIKINRMDASGDLGSWQDLYRTGTLGRCGPITS